MLRRVWEPEGWRTVHGAQKKFTCNICFAVRWEERQNLGKSDLGVKPRYRIHFLSISAVQRAPHPERKLKWATLHLIEKMLLSFLACVSKQRLREGKSKDFISWADTSGCDNPCLSVKGIAHVAKFLSDNTCIWPLHSMIWHFATYEIKNKIWRKQYVCQLQWPETT